MSEDFQSQTSQPKYIDPLEELRKSVAVMVFQVVSASSLGAQRGFLRETGESDTRTIELISDSSTKARQITPEIQARLDAMLHAACQQVIEDGKGNAITDQLAELFVKDYNAIVPVLITLIEHGRTLPVIKAEILKELGRIRDVSSHSSRRWILEHALSTSSPFVRDGAGLGLARLGDPAALKYLEKAVQDEPNVEIRSDLQSVVQELKQAVR
ncbi:MAG: HEAT repeat domain-containing protein [Bryobacteraceae bacterium]|jgi:hypothetical protein